LTACEALKQAKKTRQVPGFSILLTLDQHQNV